MPLTEATLKELKEERDALAAWLKEAEQRIEALDVLLKGQTKALPVQLSFLPGQPDTSAVIVTNGWLGGRKLREAIRIVLGEMPKGVRPIDVSRELEKRGFIYGGKTSIKVVVANELWRMEKSGKVRRTQTGRYKLPDEEKQTA